ncbi:LamG domain-containing protein [Shinella zoogloeoides]
MTFPFPTYGVTVGGGGNDEFTKLLLHFDGVDGATSIIDSSPAANVITSVGGAQIDTDQSIFGGSSLLLNGSSAYLTAPDSPSWDFTADFTIDAWVRLSNLTGPRVIASVYSGSGLGWSFQYRGDRGATLIFGSGDTTIIERPWSPSVNTWYHVAVSRTAGTLRLFINGVQSGATQSNASSFSGTTTPLQIGRLSGIGFVFAGWIDELRISNGIGRWTENFVPPSKPYG